VNPPRSTTREPFAARALYELKIDTDGDAVADIAYRVRFSSSADGRQTATVRHVEGAQAVETGDTGRVVNEAAPVSTGRDACVTEAGRYRFFAGWRSEVPNSALGPKRVGLWGVQADRAALPAQAVFLVGSERDSYHAGEPANDARFIAVFAHALEHTGGYAPEEARRVAGTLLPDMLSYDPTHPASFPSNGRTLTDDAADAFLAVLTNGKVTGDKVGPHIDLLAEFPYLGLPHNISVPSQAPSPIATELRKASRRLGSS
jgi:hypothetical protein